MEEKELNVKEEEKEVDSFLDAMKEADELKNNENEVEENKEENSTSEVEDTAEQKSKGPEKFEQISIFGDEDF